jgi:K+-sensing histidine kinase KdpD
MLLEDVAQQIGAQHKQHAAAAKVEAHKLAVVLCGAGEKSERVAKQARRYAD